MPKTKRLFAVHRVTQELIDWADKIFVMSELEDGYLAFLETVDVDLQAHRDGALPSIGRQCASEGLPLHADALAEAYPLPRTSRTGVEQ